MVNIKPLREARGLSQAALAKRMDVARPSVSYWENGIRVPSSENLSRLADALNCTADELLGRSPGP